MEIQKQLARDFSKTIKGTKNTKQYLTIHETANTSKGANAQAHANLQKHSGKYNASWHIQVDDTEAIQSFNYDICCWHAGDGGGSTSGNRTAIAIELCVNSDGNFSLTRLNGARVAAQVLFDCGIPITRMVQHNKWSGKNCPTNLRKNNNKLWDIFVQDTKDFLAMLQSEKPDKPPVPKPPVTKPPVKPPVKPAVKSVSQMAAEVIAGKHGNGHVARRRSLGIDTATYAKVRAEVNKRM